MLLVPYIMYVYKQDFASNKPQGLICHKAQRNETKLFTTTQNQIISHTKHTILEKEAF